MRNHLTETLQAQDLNVLLDQMFINVNQNLTNVISSKIPI